MNSNFKYSLNIIVLFLVLNLQAKLIAANGIIKANENHQTMVGFGASIAWADDQLTSHPQKDEIYNLIFNDLGLSILRIRNVYRNDPNDFAPTFAEIVNKMKQFSPTAKILISSWSPPANIKSNNSTDGGGTLIKDGTGKYMYGAFAQYWVDAVNAYRAVGIDPDYISIQNEPDWSATWESCVFDKTEDATNAGYDHALDSVYIALQQLQSSPKILGPEVLGIGYNEFQHYAQYFNRNHLDVYAYHLYHGESDNVNDNHNPDLFIPNLTTIANNYTGKTIFQTEYDRNDWFNTVWLIHNCIVKGNVSAYFWWELVWGSGGNPLIEMDDNTYTITKYYWAFRQYSKFISSDWKRVTATDDSDSLRISAFINPDGKRLSIIIINIGSQTQSMSFDIQDFNADSGVVVRTSETESGDTVLNSYNGKTSLDFPTRSITTISLGGNTVTEVENHKQSNPMNFSLSQNYPNPFNPATTITFTMGKEDFVSLKIYDVLGREIETLIQKVVPGGIQSVQFNAEGLNSGIYLYRMTVGNFSQSKKMMLLR